MIDIEKANIAFEKYVSNYDDDIEKIKLKKDHTKRVQQYGRKIAKSLNLTKEEQNLAELIGLLHDIGRFEQVKKYNTYVDSKSMDHADFAVSLLLDKGMIREFISDDKYDNIICKAIKNHNKYKIEEGLNEKENLYCKIVRDADKIDILNIFTTRELNYFYDDINIGKQNISDKVYQDAMLCKTINHNDKKTDIDGWVGTLTLVFDIYFNESIKIIRETKIIDKIYNRIEYTNKETIEKMNNIKKNIDNYLENS